MARSTVHYADSETNNILKRLHNKLRPAGTPVQRVEYIIELLLLRIFEVKLKHDESFTPLRKLFAGENYHLLFSHLLSLTGDQVKEHLNKHIFPFYSRLLSHARNIFTGNLPQKVQDQLVLIEEVFANSSFTTNVQSGNMGEIVSLVNEIDEKRILKTDLLGDAIESALAETGGTQDIGLHRTPDHIRQMMVALVDPNFTDTIFDPAYGSAGFLITSYEWLKYKNSDPKNIEERDGREIGYGDKLNKEQWQFLTAQTFYGFDVDPEMVRLALMNLILHGIEGAHIRRKDTVAGAEEEEDLRRFDVVLTNPPFAGKVDRERIKPTLPVKSNKTQILFLGYVINSLKPNGRAGIILPEGTLFGTNKDDKEIRRFLLENTQLQVVVSIPAGVFQPYAGVKTSFLIFKKKSTPILDKNEKIWFFNMQGDGSSLSKAKKFGPQYKNDIPKLLELWSTQKIEKPFSWFMPVKDIAENDYILSANTYNPYSGEETITHREPKEILRDIENLDREIVKQKKTIKKLI